MILCPFSMPVSFLAFSLQDTRMFKAIQEPAQALGVWLFWPGFPILGFMKHGRRVKLQQLSHGERLDSLGAPLSLSPQDLLTLPGPICSSPLKAAQGQQDALGLPWSI